MGPEGVVAESGKVVELFQRLLLERGAEEYGGDQRDVGPKEGL